MYDSQELSYIICSVYGSVVEYLLSRLQVDTTILHGARIT